jgi:hypothetical protein
MRTPLRRSIAQVLKIARAGGRSPRQRISSDAYRFPRGSAQDPGPTTATLIWGLVTRFSPSCIAQFWCDWTAMLGYRSADQNERILERRTLTRRPPSVRRARCEDLRSGPAGVVHDPVVAAAGAGRACAGPVPGEHVRTGPAVQFHQGPFGAAAFQPGMAEMMPEPVRVHRDTALLAASHDDLVNPGRGQRPRLLIPSHSWGRYARAWLWLSGTGLPHGRPRN